MFKDDLLEITFLIAVLFAVGGFMLFFVQATVEIFEKDQTPAEQIMERCMSIENMTYQNCLFIVNGE